MKVSAVIILSILFLSSCFSQSQTVFVGTPAMRIEEGGVKRSIENLTDKDAAYRKCVISRIGNKYYWASQQNAEVRKIEGTGAFIAFVAIDGVGYVNIIKPELKGAASLLSDTEKNYDYIEHMTLGLKTITYYGKRGD